MTDDLERLEALARAATPGPWFCNDWQRDGGPDTWTVEAHRREILSSGQSSIWPGGIEKIQIANTEYGERPIEDAAFIAAANPATILSLIQRVREAESNLDLAMKNSVEIAKRASTARAEALEEAAKVAEDFCIDPLGPYEVQERITAAIRALGEKAR